MHLRFFILSPWCTGKPVRDVLQTVSLIYIAAVKIENSRITQVEWGSKNVNMGWWHGEERRLALYTMVFSGLFSMHMIGTECILSFINTIYQQEVGK